MLSIKTSNPWVFWPSHICDTFPESPANKILTGDQPFEIYVDMVLKNTEGVIGTLFTLLPHYTAMDIYEGRVLFTMMDEDRKTEYWGLPFPIYDDVRMRVKWIHDPNKTFTVFINERQVHEVDLTEKSFACENDPHIIFGAGNFPKNGYNLNYTDIELYEFKVIQNNELLCHHTFEDFIFDKSVDITDNCNFMNKI